MIWVKVEGNKVVGVCSNMPPTSEAGEREPGWEERSPDDPDVQAYYQAQDRQPSVSTSDMLGFRLSMLSDHGYQRITLAVAATPGGVLLVTRLETSLSFEQPYWQIIQALWSQILNALSLIAKPSATEVANWQAIVQNCRITAIAFDAKGQMILN